MNENPFTFEFQIDLGNGTSGSLLIDELSDPYIEASKFCAKHHLSSIIVTILGDSIRDQMFQEQSYTHQKY
jgi:hypothetical protein